MKSRILILLSLLLLWTPAYSRNVKKVSATYTYYAPETMSVEEAKRTALERAKIQAIADEFGTIVSQSTSTVVSNNNGESDTQFFFVGGSDVKGEWIETIGEPEYMISYDGGMLQVSVKVQGKIREIKNAQIPLKVHLLRNGIELRNEDDYFRDGDDLYLFFQSPVDGFLLVYLIDYSEKTAYCLLPYRQSKNPSATIEHDKEYVFFSETLAEHTDKIYVDEYTLICESSEVDNNDIVLMFSPSKLIKGSSEQTENNLPRQMSLKDFNKWRTDLLNKNQDVQIIQKPISITKIK